jgi:hypothetical protein
MLQSLPDFVAYKQQVEHVIQQGLFRECPKHCRTAYINGQEVCGELVATGGFGDIINAQLQTAEGTTMPVSALGFRVQGLVCKVCSIRGTVIQQWSTMPRAHHQC